MKDTKLSNPTSDYNLPLKSRGKEGCMKVGWENKKRKLLKSVNGLQPIVRPRSRIRSITLERVSL